MPTNRRLQEHWKFSMVAPSRNTNTPTWFQIKENIPAKHQKRSLQKLSKHHSRTGFVESVKALTPNPRATISCLRRFCSSLLGVIRIRNLEFCIVKTNLTHPKGWMNPPFCSNSIQPVFPVRMFGHNFNSTQRQKNGTQSILRKDHINSDLLNS